MQLKVTGLETVTVPAGTSGALGNWAGAKFTSNDPDMPK
jgi:hypothetical protein